MYQDLENDNETKQIFHGLVEQVERENIQIFDQIISSTKPNFFKILDFQKQFTQQINTIEFESLCCLYLYSYTSRKQQYKQEIDAFRILITKLSKLRELVKLPKSLKQDKEIMEKLAQLRDYLLSCIIKFYFLVYNIKYEEEYGFQNYYYLVDKLITKKKTDNYASLDYLQQEILKQNSSHEESLQQNQEKFYEIVIKKTSQYFSSYLLNTQLIIKINKLIKRHIFIYQDRWIIQLTNLIQILNPQNIIFTENNNLINKLQGFNLKILYLQQHLVDSFYKMATKLINQGNYLFGMKMLYIGFNYRDFWNAFGFKMDLSKDYEYLLNCFSFVLQNTDKYKRQCLFYQSVVQTRKQQYEQAMLSIEEAISLDKKNVRYLGQKGIIMIRKGQYEEARKIIQECIKLANDPSSISNLGLTYYYQNNYEQALEHFQSANFLKKDNLVIKYNIISALFKQKQFDKFLDQCQSVLQMNPCMINIYFCKIRIFIDQNKQEDAINQLKILKQFESSNLWVINYDQLDYSYYYQLGLYQNDKKQYSSAIYYLFNSLKLNPMSKVMKIGSNLLDLQEDETREFHNQVNKYLKMDQNYFYCLSIYISSYLQIASVHLDSKNYSNYSFIINNLAQIITIEEIRNSQLQELVRFILQVQFNFFYALEKYFKLNVASKFKTTIQMNYLQLIYQQTGQLYDNLIFSQIQNDQDQLNLEFMEGYFFFDQNNFHQAELYFEKYIIQNPNSLDARLMLGNLYQKLKKYNESIIQFDYINKGKANKWAYTQKAYSYFCMGLIDKLYPLYQEASKYYPNDFELLICNAIYLYESQQFKQALELFNLLFQKYLDKKIDYLQFRYGMIYYELNDKPNALNKLSKTLNKNQAFIQFINQGFIYEKQNSSKAIQFYVDIISIFQYKEQYYINQRISILKNSQQRNKIQQ